MIARHARLPIHARDQSSPDKAPPPIAAAAMDDASKLVTELQTKLSELDGKVAAYRHDLAAEFQRYSEHLLQGVSDDVCLAVSRAISESMSGYPSLYPNHCTGSDSRDHSSSPSSCDSRHDRPGRKSPPPVLLHTSGKPKEDVRNPHAREKEFHGLFTPNYLPLLDNADRPLHSPPIASPPTSPAPATSGELGQAVPQTPSLDEIARPQAIRRQTDSSVDSGSSESKSRRSALRRSSNSSNKASPRRVRFDFEGEEVLPTSSPETSRHASEDTVTSQSHSYGHLSLDPSDESTDIPPSDAIAFDVDDLPPARKVSSSEALRALSKRPLEDPSKWTVVNSDTALDAGSPVVKDTTATMSTKSGASGINNLGKSSSSHGQDAHAVVGGGSPSDNHDLGSPLEDLATQDDDDSDDDFVAMRPSKQGRTLALKPSTNTSASSARENVNGSDSQARSPAIKANHDAERINGDGNAKVEAEAPFADDDEDEDLFEMDDDIGYPLSRTPKMAPKTLYIPELEEEDDEDKAEAEDVVASLPPHTPLSITPRTAETHPAVQQPVAASVGSLMGRSLTFSVVKNPLLHEEASKMGDFSSFVGSVDGRSGVDRADLSSFRASLHKVGTPIVARSFSERMAMEEAQEASR